MQAPTDTTAHLLGRAYALILSWPCDICGKPGPCDCEDAPPATTGADSGTEGGNGCGTGPSVTASQRETAGDDAD